MNDLKQKKFLSLYEPVHDRFERFCRARACGQMDFRDLMNDTLVIAFQKFEGLKSEKAFLSFLFGIAIRVVSNQLKKKREVGFIDEREVENIESDARSDVDVEIYILHRAIAKLPVNQKESIILFEISGFSIKEIAALHQVSESAVKKRLERGRKKLIQLLTNEPGLQIKKGELL
ncbi:MAG: RNA polymerase sigma factor [Bacteroidota bacterium]